MKKDRQLVFEMFGGRCAYCGCELQKGWHVDHIEPIRRYKWGDGCAHPEKDCIENKFPSCPSCNINKHGQTIEGFRAAITKYLASLNLRSVPYKMVKKFGLVEETQTPVIFYFETLI